MAGGSLADARARILAAKRVYVLTGAGISAESGVPTFRGNGGLWRTYRPQDLATPQAFEADPKLVWEWYEWRRDIVAGAKPNAAHQALVELEQRTMVLVVTQNVDGLHGLAGTRALVELHGSLWTVRCTACGQEREDRTALAELPPVCACGGLERPGVVWFGESLPDHAIHSAMAAAATWAEVVLVIGTSAVVQPAASLAGLARKSGAFVIEVNPEDTGLEVDLALRGKAAEVVPALVG